MSKVSIVLKKDFSFDAAHYLPKHPGKCREMHGHTWTGTITCAGNSDLLQDGILVDFGKIKEVVKQLDHTTLNKLPQFKHAPPTAENIAAWLLQEIPYAIQVDLNETPGNKVIVTHV